MAELAFNEAEHVYRVGGQIVPSVTQILSILQDFGAVSAEILARAAEFGSHVHQAIDLDNKGALDEAALDPALVPYLAGWRAFLRETGAELLGSEVRVYHSRLQYAGTLDALVRIRDKIAVVDVKTGVVPRTVGPQLAAYKAAYAAWNDEHLIRRRLCVQLTGDGYRIHDCKDPADESIFMSCRNIYRWRHQ